LGPESTKCYVCRTMCRNIRVLHNFEPPTTLEEMRAASLQYVRKVSGLNKAPKLDAEIFERAVDEVAAATEKLLHALHPHGHVRTREDERLRAQARWKQREARLAGRSS
jgi:hypothetical protein